MSHSIFESGQSGATEGLSIDPASLYRAFEQVRDRRRKKGKRYPLPLLLTLVLLGKLAGETSVNGIVEWINERQAWLRSQLDWPKRFPTNSIYNEALAHCDTEQIVTMIAACFRRCDTFAPIDRTPCCYYSASFCGSTGTPKSPADIPIVCASVIEQQSGIFTSFSVYKAEFY